MGKVSSSRPAVVRQVRVGTTLSNASTAAEQRLRTARCSGVTPPVAVAFGSAPASTRQRMTARCCVGFQWGAPGPPITAACSGSAPRRSLARMSAPRSTSSRAIAGVVAERRRVERRGPFVDLGEAFGQEELVASSQAGGHQRRGRVQQRQSGLVDRSPRSLINNSVRSLTGRSSIRARQDSNLRHTV